MGSSPLSPTQPKRAGALLAGQGQNRQWLCPCPHERQYGHKDGHGSWSGHLHSPADAQQTSHDVGAAVSQLHHAAGSQGTNGFLGFAVLTVQMKDTYSSAERQPAPRMGGMGGDTAGYVVSFPQRPAVHSLHRSA